MRRSSGNTNPSQTVLKNTPDRTDKSAFSASVVVEEEAERTTVIPMRLAEHTAAPSRRRRAQWRC